MSFKSTGLRKATVFVIVTAMMLAILQIYVYATDSKHYVELFADGKISEYNTKMQTVAAFLQEQGVSIGAYDMVTPELDYPLAEDQDGTTIFVARGFPVHLVDDGQRITIPALFGMSVSDIVMQYNDETGQTYYASNADMLLTEETDIQIVKARVAITEDIEEMEYDTQIIINNNLPMDSRKVVQKGVNGSKRVVKTAFYSGDKALGYITDEIVVIEPVPRVIEESGEGLGSIIDTTSEDFKYIKAMTMNASAYNVYEMGLNPNSKNFGKTATGAMVKHGIVAVDPKVIPLGTLLYVEGYGVALAADTGGAIKGAKIDLYMEDPSAPRKFGRRDVKVYILADVEE